MADAKSSTVLGATIGKHRIVRLIGGGAVGRVFVCRLADLDADDAQVAIKVLRTRRAAAGDRLMRDRLLVEKISSPHVVRVNDVSVYNNVPYVVMELVEGESLAARLERGPLKSAEALEVARAICLGLQAGWSVGLAHGDVQPRNVLLPEGDLRRAKLGDFLLPAPVEGTESVRGTPAYLAPEILVGTPPDPLSDLYALGCVLYECVTGKTPFVGSPASLLHAQVSTPPPSLAASVPGPQGLVDLVDRLLEKDRSKRVKTHAEALECIERALRGLSMPAPKQPQVPELDLDIHTDGASFEDSERTDEVHTSPARDRLLDEISEPPAPSPVVRPRDDTGVYRGGPQPKDAPAARAPDAYADIEVDAGAGAVFDDVHDDGIDMTMVADAAMLLAAAEAQAEPEPPAVTPRGFAPRAAPPPVDDLEPPPGAAFPQLRDESVEMTTIADPALLQAAAAAAAPPAKMRSAAGIRGASPIAGRGAASAVPVVPVIPVIPVGLPMRRRREDVDEEPEERTRIQPGIAAPIPSAEDLGLILEPVPPKPKE